MAGGKTPPVDAPSPDLFDARERLIIDFGDADELSARMAKARKGESWPLN